MLSTDKNVETLAQLIEVLKSYLSTQKEYVKLDVTDKVVRLLTAATLAVVFLFCITIMVLFLSLGLASWLTPRMGAAGAYLTVAGIYAFVMLVLFAFRKPWIERPLVRALAQMLLN